MLNYNETKKLYYKACYDMLYSRTTEEDFTPKNIDDLVNTLGSYCELVIDKNNKLSDEEVYTIIIDCIHQKMKVIYFTRILRKNIRFKPKKYIINEYFSFRQKRVFTERQKDVIIDVLLNNEVQSRIYSMNEAYNYANVHFKEVEISKYEKYIKSYRLTPDSYNMAFEVKPNNCGDIVLVLCNIDRAIMNPMTEKEESVIRVVPIYSNSTTNKKAYSTIEKMRACML